MKFVSEDERFYDAAKTISRGNGHFTDDLFIHCIEELMKNSTKRLNKLVDQGKLIAFFIMILKNQLHSNTSSFFRLYRHDEHKKNRNYEDYSVYFENTETTGIIPDHEIPTEYEFIWDNVKDKLDELYWYERDLFILYHDLGTYQKVQDATGIPYFSLSQTIREVKDFLREEVDYEGLKQEYHEQFGDR